MKITVQCSNCGYRSTFPYRAWNVVERVQKGWNRCGNNLYCPMCVEDWNERNPQLQLLGFEKTIKLIDHIARLQEGAEQWI